MSSNDFTLETIALSFSGGSSGSPFLIGRMWEIIQGYVFNKTWKAEEEHAGSVLVSFLDYFLSTIAACCNTSNELSFFIAFIGGKKKTHHYPKNTYLTTSWPGSAFQKQPGFYFRYKAAVRLRIVSEHLFHWPWECASFYHPNIHLLTFGAFAMHLQICFVVVCLKIYHDAI